jgi:signal transduction histidine kinase
VLIACLVLTAAITWTHRLLFGLHQPSLHLVLDSVDACIAVLVVFLLTGRYRRDGTLRSLLLAAGLLLLVLAPILNALVTALEPARFGVWWAQAVRVEGALLVGWGALAGSWRRARHGSAVVLGSLAAMAAIGGALYLARSSLPLPVDSSPPSAASPTIEGHPALLVAHAVGALAFLAAAVVFARDDFRRDVPDELVRSLAPALVLGAFSRVHYMLYPSLYSGWLYTGDLLRTGMYAVLLVGAAREISSHWATQSSLAVREDRRRLARELHDGVVQELVFIAMEGEILEDATRSARIVEAAQRGLDEARGAVDLLAQGEEPTFALALHGLASQLTDRYGVQVVLDVDVSVAVPPETSHALLRIAREAAGNAARHGGASRIGIGLTRDSQQHQLVVHDNGCGFDPARISGRGYGLTSMKDRARGLQGDLDLRTSVGRGTTVTVTW